MAKFASEGYCPNPAIEKLWSQDTDRRLYGLWSIVADAIVYESEDKNQKVIDPETCNLVFSNDSIAYDVLSAIVKRNASVNKIKVYQLHTEVKVNSKGIERTSLVQKTSDIQKVLGEVSNPELFIHRNSRFVAILADTEYGMDLWVWDLYLTW